MKRPEISVILNAHSEGYLLHRAIRSALRAKATAEEAGISVEVLVIADSPTPATEEYLSSCTEPGYRTARVSFGELGQSRNYGISNAAGKYVAFLEGDDLFAHDWLLRAYQFLESENNPLTIAHSEILFSFGSEWFGRIQVNSDDPNFSRYDLIHDCLFCSNSMGSRDLYLKYPFTKNDIAQGFGREDWHWSCESLCNGVVHKAVPETAYFYRRRADVAGLRSTPHITLKKSKLFESGTSAAFRPDNASKEFSTPHKKCPISAILKAPLRGTLRFAKKWAIRLTGNSPRFRHILRQAYLSIKEARALPKFQTKAPSWLLNSWKEISDIEPGLFIDQDRVDTLRIFRPSLSNPVGSAYEECLSFIEQGVDIVFLIPWIKKGGSDKVTLSLTKSIIEKFPGKRILLIPTENVPSEPTHLPENVFWMPLGNIAAKHRLSEEMAAQLLTKLLIQIEPSVIWNINSYLGYRTYARFGKALSSVSTSICSVFGPALRSSGKKEGLAFTQLPEAISFMDFVFTDNQAIVRDLRETFGFSEKTFNVLYSPIEVPRDQLTQRPAAGGPTKILWAGRFDWDKRPDVLFRVAKLMQGSPFEFHVFGEVVLGDADPIWIKKLAKLPNVKMRGKFASFEQLAAEGFDAFLYTSHSDGLPNILLEAGVARIPVIAPNVGGVGELISPETGILVSGCEAIDEYRAALLELRSNPAAFESKSAALIDLIAGRHSWASFSLEVEKSLKRYLEAKKAVR